MVPHGPVPLFVELCAGTAALSLAFHARGEPLKSRKGAFKQVKPPVSRMGSKAGYAAAILDVLGLEQGQGARDGTRYLWCEPDPGVRLLLESYRDAGLARAAADIIRGWAGEDPRALWERLRAEGPPRGVEAGEVARWALLGEWAFRRGEPASGPAGETRWANGPWRNAAGEVVATRVGLTAEAMSGRWGLPALDATVCPDARAVDPREVARWAWVQRRSAHAKGDSFHGGNDTHKISVDAPAQSMVALPTLPADIAPDALTIDPAPCLPAGTIVYIDPPYAGTTKYASDLPRADVVALARRWADAGATVCLSEQVAIPELVADGWEAIDISDRRVGQRRTFSKQQSEFLTLKRASQ